VVNKRKHNAFSLVELIVVLGILAALAALAIPGIKAMQKSFDSTGAESMIGTALSTARTLAIKNQRYAGVRFQKAYDSNEQYMIFVTHNPNAAKNMDYIFTAVEGYKPIKLPDNVGIIDMTIRTNNGTGKLDSGICTELPVVENDFDVNLERTMRDISAFSIIFSPTGKLVRNHDVRVRNQNGDYHALTPKDSEYDTVFNSLTNIQNGTGMFLDDDYADYGLGGEKSRDKFYIYDIDIFKKMNNKTDRFNYLDAIKHNSINPYTGEILKKIKD
jgi:prepilin-type N-terminal cleavage/methylation domain-containing protein